MSLLPDPDTLLAVAERITRHATAVRRHADILAVSVGRTTWHGTAARSFAHEALEVGASLRRCADRLDAAATALRRHAARVRAELDLLGRVGSAAVHAAGAAVHVAGDILDAAGI